MIQNSLESMVLISSGCGSAPVCSRPRVNGDWRSVHKKERLFMIKAK